MSKTPKVLIGVVVVAAVIVAGGVWWFLRDDAPAPVSLDTATGALDTDGGGSAGSTGIDDTDGTRDGAEIDGAWVVDTETGEFDWDTATGTFAGFRVEEELANIGSATAVGRTGDISGGLTIDDFSVIKADFSVEMVSLRTNNNMRDSRVRSALDTSRFPDAKLSITEPIPLPADAASGSKVNVAAPARLTLHGVTEDVTLDIEARYVDGRIVIVGSTEIVFSDFDIQVPSSPVVLSVRDHGVMEFQALMQRG